MRFSDGFGNDGSLLSVDDAQDSVRPELPLCSQILSLAYCVRTGHDPLVVVHPRHSELALLAESGDASQLLEIVTMGEVADAYCDYFRIAHKACDDEELSAPEYWVMEFYFNCLGELPQSWRREFILELVDRARDDDRLLLVIGAGPFEDYVDPFDLDEVEWLERNAARSASFRTALRNMRLPFDLPGDLRRRINSAAGHPLDRY